MNQPVVMPPPGGICQFRLPFIEDDSLTPPPRTYWQMLATYFSPYFSFRTWSFFFIVVTFIGLVVPQFIFMPLNKTPKLFSYPAIPGVYMSPIEVKFINHWAIYKCFTTLLFHLNYTHWLGNLLGITINLFTMEYCWCPSIIIALIGGTVSSAYAAVAMNAMLMGFSGVIACSVGLYFAMFLSNWTFLRNRFPQKVVAWFISCIFVFILLFNQDPRSTLVHFIAFFIGLIYGHAWLPKIAQDGCERTITIVCKILSVIITVLPFVIIFMHPTTGPQSLMSRGLFPNTLINTGQNNMFNPMMNMQPMQPTQQPGVDMFAKQPKFHPGFQSNIQPGSQTFQQFQPFQQLQQPQMMQPNVMNIQRLPQMNQWF